MVGCKKLAAEALSISYPTLDGIRWWKIRPLEETIVPLHLAEHVLKNGDVPFWHWLHNKARRSLVLEKDMSKYQGLIVYLLLIYVYHKKSERGVVKAVDK